jgi:putative transposase
MKYRFMARNGSGFEVKKMCRVWGVNRSGYYAFLRGDMSRRQEENLRLLFLIREIWRRSRGLYGSPRITAELRSSGLGCGKNRVSRLMREAGIKARTKKRFKVTTKHFAHQVPAPDLLGKDFAADAVNKVWVSDITSIRTGEGWLYLAAVMDVYNRQIVGWALEERITKDLVLRALHEAIVRHKPKPGLIIHSDRGSQYASRQVKELLAEQGFRQSMCAHCYGDALMESFFSSLKSELVQLEIFHTKSQARRRIFDYLEVFYNRQRRHSALNYSTPMEYYREAVQT